MPISKYKKNKILAKITDGHSLYQACKDEKVSRATFYRHMAKDEELNDTVRTAQKQAAEKALEELEGMFLDTLHKRKIYDPNLLRDLQHMSDGRCKKYCQRSLVKANRGLVLRLVMEH